MKSKLSFACPSLQKINSEADIIITNHLQDLDRISNDIKALEERLKDAAIPFTFIYVISSEERRYRDTVIRYDVPDSADFIEHTDNCIVWGRNEEGDYRLSHNLYTTIGEIETYDPDGGAKIYERVNQGETRLTSCKPLIETKSHFRVKIEKELPTFYGLILEALKTKRHHEKILAYSPENKRLLEFSKIDLDAIPF